MGISTGYPVMPQQAASAGELSWPGRADGALGAVCPKMRMHGMRG